MLQADLKQERRQLKKLKARALDQRCNKVLDALQVKPLPQLLLLNLARRDTDKPQLLPALAFSMVPTPPLQSNSKADVVRGPFFFCLGADNRLMVASVIHVVGVHDDDVALEDLRFHHPEIWQSLCHEPQSWLSDSQTQSWSNYAGRATACGLWLAVPELACIATAMFSMLQH